MGKIGKLLAEYEILLSMTPPGKIHLPTFNIEEVNKLIRQRRSIFPKDFSGEKVSRAEVELLLENAHWAPTHGKTEPWFFKVYSGDALQSLGEAHAALYKQEMPADQFQEVKYEKLKKRPTECSHVIAICMKRGKNPKIPAIEEVSAVACAVQNMYLTTTALGFAGYWSPSGMTYHPGMKEIMGLGEEDQFMGFFMLGRPKDKEYWPKGYRKSGFAEKVEWVEE